MLVFLEERILLCDPGDWTLPAMCVAHTIAVGVVRFQHVQRSNFLLRKKDGWWCYCELGKGKDDTGCRTAFVWFCPAIVISRKLVHRGVTPVQILYRL